MERKTETLNLHIPPELMAIARRASATKPRMLSNLAEFLVWAYRQRHQIAHVGHAGAVGNQPKACPLYGSAQPQAPAQN